MDRASIEALISDGAGRAWAEGRRWWVLFAMPLTMVTGRTTRRGGQPRSPGGSRLSAGHLGGGGSRAKFGPAATLAEFVSDGAATQAAAGG